MNEYKIICELKKEFDLTNDAEIQEILDNDEAVNAFDVAGITIPESWSELASLVMASHSELASEIKFRASAV